MSEKAAPSMAWTRRLPRSNKPQPDESLAGYVLNLAHRLDMSPGDLLKRTGLTSKDRAHHLQLRFGMRLPDDVLDRFATATGLTDVEARNLTLQRFADLTTIPRMSKTHNVGQWMDIRNTRYCPQCLTEPLSPGTQPQPGDPELPHPVWRTQWITPWLLACSRHGRLLLEACPRCGTRVGQSAGSIRSLIPHVDVPVIHPTACRARPHQGRDVPVCGYRLDQATAPKAPSPVLTLQRTFDQILDGTQPDGLTSVGAPVDARQYLRDLRLVVIVLQLANNPLAFEMLDAPYRHAGTAYLSDRRATFGDRDRRARTLTLPPDGHSASIALIQTAAHLLRDGGDGFDSLGRLSRQALANEKHTWRTAQATSEPSPALWGALTISKLHTTAPGRIVGHLGDQRLSLEVRHIPAYLPRGLYDKHFHDVAPSQVRRLRRHVCIALVRLLDERATAEQAGALLGYNAARTAEATGRAMRFTMANDKSLAARIADIAKHFEHQPRVDYGTPRAHIDTTWTIPEEPWDTTKRTLTNIGLARPNNNWAKRHTLYRLWLWETLTGGDLINAPAFNDPASSFTDPVKSLRRLQSTGHPAHHQIVSQLAETLRPTFAEL